MTGELGVTLEGIVCDLDRGLGPAAVVGNTGADGTVDGTEESAFDPPN